MGINKEQEKEVLDSLVEKGGEVEIDFIDIVSVITNKCRGGSIRISIQVQGMSVTDRELAWLRRLQEEAAAKADEMLKE